MAPTKPCCVWLHLRFALCCAPTSFRGGFSLRSLVVALQSTNSLPNLPLHSTSSSTALYHMCGVTSRLAWYRCVFYGTIQTGGLWLWCSSRRGVTLTTYAKSCTWPAGSSALPGFTARHIAQAGGGQSLLLIEYFLYL